jgi:hypothetical protein
MSPILLIVLPLAIIAFVLGRLSAGGTQPPSRPTNRYKRYFHR